MIKIFCILSKVSGKNLTIRRAIGRIGYIEWGDRESFKIKPGLIDIFLNYMNMPRTKLHQIFEIGIINGEVVSCSERDSMKLVQEYQRRFHNNIWDINALNYIPDNKTVNEKEDVKEEEEGI